MSFSDWPLRPWPDQPQSLPQRLDAFDCGKPPLDAFLKKTALFNQQTGVSRTTWCHPADNPETVAGYYSLAIAPVLHDELPSQVRRRLIEQPMQAVPLLARLAVDQRFRGQGLGGRLLIAALADVVRLWEIVGGPVVAVQPIDDEAVSFYRHYGFSRIEGAKHMFLRISTARKLLGVAR